MKTEINSEDLAYWYLRLNGFLTIRNFIVHPDRGSNQETDVDLLAVRFPFRGENLKRPMQDDHIFAGVNVPYLVFAEVKSGQCSLNGPWTRPERQNMFRVLQAVGAFPFTTGKQVADHLYTEGFFENADFRVSIICFGNEKNNDISSEYSLISQILWPDCLRFIFRRFRAYKNEKVSHGQWDDVGKMLWDKTVEHRDDVGAFVGSFQVT